MDRDDEPRWLSTEQTGAWIALAALTTALPAALDAQLRRDAGISHTEYQVLSWLSMNQDRTGRMSEIAALANVSLSHLSRIASRLEDRGWLERRTDPEDGRVTLATLTGAGWAAVVDAAPGHVEEVRRLVFDPLTGSQVAQLRAIAERILSAVRPGLCLPEVRPASREG